jgi:hypothetical protein
LLEFWSFDGESYELAYALLALAFERTLSNAEAKALSGVQCCILKALAAQDAVWHNDGCWPDELSKRGLPSNRKELARLATAGLLAVSGALANVPDEFRRLWDELNP